MKISVANDDDRLAAVEALKALSDVNLLYADLVSTTASGFAPVSARNPNERRRHDDCHGALDRDSG